MSWASNTTNPPCDRTPNANRPALPPLVQTEPSRGRIETWAASLAAVEPDVPPFPAARQVFDTRNTTSSKKDGNTTQHTHYLLRSPTTQEASASHLGALARGQWSVENPNHRRRVALWGEDRYRLRNENAAYSALR
jgi:hypothetical protein